MDIVLWVVIAVAAIAGAGYFGTRKLKSGATRKALPAAPRRTLSNIQVNDIVSHFGTDYLVEACLTYDDDGDEWFVYRLVDGDDVVWLSVEEDDALEVGFFRDLDDLRLTERPGETLSYGGKEYRQEEWGRATVTRMSETGTKKLGVCTYFDYEGPDGETLSITQWGEGEFEASLGKPIRPVELDILPGDFVTKE